MKTILVTGASSGIGLACANEFAKDYNVVTVCRNSGATFRGDLLDPDFRRVLVQEISPDVFINNAGIFGSDHEVAKTFELNFVAAGELLIEFYRKMNSGHIINVTSAASHSTGSFGMSYAKSAYCASKAALQRLSVIIAKSGHRPVKVSSIEPALVDRGMSDFRERIAKRDPDDLLTVRGIQPMEPEYVASTIRWILQQPDHVTIKAMEIANTPRFEQSSEESAGYIPWKC